MASKRGFSLIELLVVIAIILTLAAIALPNFMRARIQANESAIVGALRAITIALVSYETSFQQGYPNALSNLGPAPPGTMPTPATADLIDGPLASGTRSGYTILYASVDTTGDGRPDTFTVNANPASPGVTGNKHFYVDPSNVIRYNATGPAGPADRPIPQ